MWVTALGCRLLVLLVPNLSQVSFYSCLQLLLIDLHVCILSLHVKVCIVRKSQGLCVCFCVFGACDIGMVFQ